MFDIFFISYQEPNADSNFAILQDRFPIAQRVHGVKGIHQAHKEAAKKALTKMFWVVDGDAIVEEDFNFDYEVPQKDMNAVHVWKSRNPVNNLVYGYGGVKLLPRDLTLNMSIGTTDMTTSISDRFRPMEQISNVSAFNTSPFNTWKSAFRECVKLSSKVIDRQEDAETEARLDAWCKSDDPMAVDGAIAGRKYGTENKNNKEAISKINDFEWIRQIYKNGK
tara:strand:+ start:5077 stop:5742 length:666 start_codon:yes stop_codon:yes gene_type:complete